MTPPDLKSAALDFTREHRCPPACLVEEAMRRGAELMAEAMTKELSAVRADMEKHRKEIERGTPHGHASGFLLF